MRVRLRRVGRLAGALSRRGGVPAEEVALLDLRRGERVLASAEVRGGRRVVATTLALHRPVPGEGFVRIPWDDVISATWDDQRSALTVEAAPPDGARERHVLALEDAGRLPETVRERVQSTILVSRHVPLVGKRGVRVVGRRIVGAGVVSSGRVGDGVRWHVVPDAGIDLQDPELQPSIAAAVSETREQLDG
jgi:hypothetical protein